MKNNPFERQSLTVWAFVVFLMSLPVAFIWLTIFGARMDFQDWKGPIFLTLFDGGIFLAFLFICSLIVMQLFIKYTDEGVEQPSFFHSKFLYWRDVQEIRNITTKNIILVGSEVKIDISPYIYKNPFGLLAEIRSRIPASAYPSDAQISQEINRRKRGASGSAAILAFLAGILAWVVGKNEFAFIFGFLFISYGLYETWNWLKYGREQ